MSHLVCYPSVNQQSLLAYIIYGKLRNTTQSAEMETLDLESVSLRSEGEKS